MKQKKRTSINRKGGDAGEVFIFSKIITGNGKILADGGDGAVGGKGGKVTLFSENNQFTGKVSAKGGASLNKINWWEKSWIQAIMFISAIIGIIGFVWYLYAK